MITEWEHQSPDFSFSLMITVVRQQDGRISHLCAGAVWWNSELFERFFQFRPNSNDQAENDPDGLGVLVCSFCGEGVHRVLVNKVSFVRVGKGVEG